MTPCSAYPSMGLIAGARIAGYEILAPLGAGGMGEVYRARDEYLGREVAIKMLPAHRQHDTAAIDRFFREARAASALNHPHIVTIHGAGHVDAGHFIVMELVRGYTLRRLIGGTVPEQTLRDLTSQIARALAAAHDAGIVHRDIKPENIMVRDDGYVKVLDFGLARLEPQLGKGDLTRSVTQRIVGTPRYLSPERFRGISGDAATDIFSLGIVLYELATGRHPFSAGFPYEVVVSILTDQPVPPSRVNPEVSADLDALILRMLEKEPTWRPSAAEVVKELASPLPISRTPSATKVHAGPNLVGRSQEQVELRTTFARAVAGHGVMICVTGEAGIGKTTLVEDFLAERTQTGEPCRIARGRCSERLAGSEAYLPILDALENLVRVSGGDGLSMSRLLKTVAPLWHSQVASTGTDALSTIGSNAPAMASQERLKRELVAFLEEATRTQPLILFFDDVHWADVSTVDLLGYVASRFASMRILIIVTYRPEELLRVRHPFLRVKQDLQSRGSCFELELGFLTTTDLETYLGFEFKDHRFPSTFARLLHEKTEGNPLFMVDVLRYLRGQGVLSREMGSWTLSQALPDIARSLPESVRSMIQRKIDLLDEEDRRLLLAASVQGYEFDAAVVAHVLGMDPAAVEERLDRLDRIHAFVRAGAEREFPDRTVTIRYRFVHVLYQNMLYATLTHARKVSLALGVVRKLETSYGAQIKDIAVEVAVLCEVGREFARAADYFKIAAQHAAQVFAYREAILLAERGLEVLMKLDDNADRKRQELTLLLKMGVPLIVATGFGDARVGEVFARAHSLALELNDHSDFIEILWGLGNFNLVTLKLDAAYESASDLLALAEKTAGPSLQIQAHHLIGLVCYHRGDFYSALEHTGRVATLYDSRLHRAHATTYGFDTRVASGSYSACAYWTVGQPDRALAEIEFVLGYARELAHAHTLAYALFFGTLLHQFRREWEKARNLAEELLAVSSDKGLIHFLNASRIFIGLAEAETADREQGIDQMRRGLTAYRATGAETSRPRVRAQIAEHLGKAGRVEEALTIVTDEIESIGSARFHLSELYRVKGDLLALSASHVVGNEAELWFQRAIDLARDQKAKSFELRAVMSLCRHRRQRGSPDDARRLLNDLYGTFTEGLDTGDLKEAQAMLAEDPGPN